MTHAVSESEPRRRRPLRDSTQAGGGRVAWIAMGALLLLGVVLRIPQLGHALTDAAANRQAQFGFAVRGLAEQGVFDWLPVFGSHDTVPTDLPVASSIASLLVPLGLDPSAAARLIGLLGFTATGALLGVLVLRWHGRIAAIVAVGLFELLPFGLHWGAAALPTSLGVALALLMAFGLDAWVGRGARWGLVVGGLGGLLGIAIAPTAAPVYLLLVAGSSIAAIRASGWAAARWRVILAAVGPVLGAIGAVAWTVSADAQKAGDPLTEFLTSGELRRATFGTVAERLDAASYATVFSRIAGEIAGPGLIALLVAVLAVVLWRDARQQLRLASWLAVGILSPLIFFGLAVHEPAFLLGAYPALVAAIGVGGVWLIRSLPVTASRGLALAVVAAVALFAVTSVSAPGRADVAALRSGTPVSAISSLLLDQTKPGDKIVIIGCDWDPSCLYEAHRTGLMLRGANAGDVWKVDHIGDYSFLFSCDSALRPSDYLPAGTVASPLPSGGFFALRAAVG